MTDVDVNAPAELAPAMAPPTRTDDQILPRIRWVPVGKSNCYLDVDRSQSNPIYKIAVDLLKELTTIINLCLTGKTLGFERPRALVLQILWGVINRAHIDYPERMWEEFTQSIHTFIEDKKNLAPHTQGKKKATLIVIPSFSAKGTKREVFGMPIPNDLITDDIRGEQYYNAYLEKVAKHQRYLAGEEVSDPDSPAPKPKATKQSKPLAPKAATKKPKPAPAKPLEKKRKLDTVTPEVPSPDKRSKPGKVAKKRTIKSSLQLADEFVDEGVPENDPWLDDEEAATQRAIEESLKEVHDTRQGPLSPVVFREPDFGKFQPLPKVQGKGKEKKRTPATSEPSGLVESSSLYAELGLTDSKTDSDEEVSPEMNAGAQEEGQDGTNPGDAAVSQTQSSHVVHAGPNLDHMDLGVAEAASQPNPEQMDEEFTTTIYPSVQENLKLPTEGKVRLEEPASSAGTLSSLQNLDKDLSFTNQFLAEKSQPDEPQKTNKETENQDLSGMMREQTMEYMRTQEIDNKINEMVKEAVTTSVQYAMRAPLYARFKDLPTSDMKEILL
ncbi:hypothetical protein Tco_1392788 [Tanacetum coccineum]